MDEAEKETKNRFTFWLVTATFLSSLSSFNFGYNIAVLNTPEQIIRQFYNETYYQNDPSSYTLTVSTWLWSATVSVYNLFGMFGAFLSGAMADRLGRKRAILINHLFMFIGASLELLTPFVNAPYLLKIGRSFVGFNCGMAVGLVCLYLTEIAPKRIRGALGACHQLQTVFGILFAQVLGLPQALGSENLWSVLAGFSLIPMLISLVFFPFCPESPRYLLLTKRKEKAAEEALMKLRSDSESQVKKEMDEMKAEGHDEAKETKRFSMLALIKSKSLRRALILALVLQVAQQWSGINSVMMYSNQIFQAADVAEESIPLTIMGVGIVNAIATIVAMPLVEKLGRRKLLIWPMVVMGISMCLLTVSIKLQEQSSAFPMISSILVFTYVVAFAVGLGPIPPMIVAELFRQEPRPAAMALSQVMNWSCNLTLVIFFEAIKNAIGAFTFLLFTGVTLICGIYIHIVLPETKNRTFEQITQALHAKEIKVASLEPKKVELKKTNSSDDQKANMPNEETETTTPNKQTIDSPKNVIEAEEGKLEV